MSAPDETPPAAPRRSDEEIVAEHEIIRLAGFNLDHFLSLSDHEQRLVLKMAQHLLNAERRAEPE